MCKPTAVLVTSYLSEKLSREKPRFQGLVAIHEMKFRAWHPFAAQVRNLRKFFHPKLYLLPILKVFSLKSFLPYSTLILH